MILLWLGLEPNTKADRDNLSAGLQHLLGAEPDLAVRTGASDGVTMLGAGSEEQLERVADRLAREFGVEAAVSIEIAYKEALTTSAFGEAKYAKQIGGRGEYAHVKITIRPGDPGSGFVFDNTITGGAIPGPFVKPIAEALRRACDAGVLAGYPIEDVHISLYDGSYHDVDSSADAFRTAAAMAFRDAATNARPVLLEPIMRVLLTVPAEYEAQARARLTARPGAKSLFTPSSSEWSALAAHLPLAETFGLAREVRAVTAGRGLCEIRFSHYAPATLAEDGGDRDSPVREPNQPRKPPNLLRAAVPEPVDHTSGDEEAFRPYRS